jgi:hypothetical protein
MIGKLWDKFFTWIAKNDENTAKFIISIYLAVGLFFIINCCLVWYFLLAMVSK